MRDRIKRRKDRQPPEHQARLTRAAARASERKQAEASTHYTADDLPEIPIQVVIIDHRFGETIEIDLYKTGRVNSFHLVDVNAGEVIGKHGAVRGLREIARKYLREVAPTA